MLQKFSDVTKLYTKTEFVWEEKWKDITVDLILPIYNGYEMLQTLLASIEQTEVVYHIYLVDDCSTDERIPVFLKEYQENHTNVTVQTNLWNQGYIKSVNVVLQRSTNHVVLLNTDVELPNQWLERLLLPILIDDTVASVTPFSNAGNICSFPVSNSNNTLVGNQTLEEMDEIFRSIVPKYYEIPTGVGFCMAMNKEAIQSVGIYNEVDYINAYGEENDWCERAKLKGYHHVIADNLFVYHQHHASYKDTERLRMQHHNMMILKKKYPFFYGGLTYFNRHIPYANLIQLLMLQCGFKKAEGNVWLVFHHSMGGGSTIFIEEKIKTWCGQGGMVLLVKYERQMITIEMQFGTYKAKYQLARIEELEQLFLIGQIPNIVVNSLVHYWKLKKVMKEIIRIKETYGCNVEYYVHDYFCLCPTIHLIDRANEYCGYPDNHSCKLCKSASYQLTKYTINTMETWRNEWEEFLIHCDSIYVFSMDTKIKLTQQYKELKDQEQLIQITQPITYISKVKEPGNEPPYIVGVLGSLCHEKGQEIVYELSQLMQKEGQENIKIVIIGSCSDKKPSSNITVTGAYNKEMLSILIEQYRVQVILIPSIIPETFSLTTEEAIHTGLPVIVFPLGAQAERVTQYENGHVADQVSAESMYEEIKKVLLS